MLSERREPSRGSWPCISCVFIIPRSKPSSGLKGFGIHTLSYGITAAGAILQYLDLTEHRDIKHITRISRIEEAQLQINIAEADYYPAIGYNAYGSSFGNSEVSGLSNQAGGGINISYTVDLWQKIKMAL